MWDPSQAPFRQAVIATLQYAFISDETRRASITW